MNIIADDREKLPWEFQGIFFDSGEGGGLMPILVERSRLSAGDYTTVLLSSLVRVERKSKADLYGTLSQNRKRFERELELLSDTVELPIVVVESSYGELIANPPEFTRMPPKAVSRIIMKLLFDYKKVHWLYLDNRRVAEVWVAKFFHKLERELA